MKHEDTIDYDQEIDRLWQSSSTLQIIPEKMYHGEKVTCIVKWESMPEVRNGVCSLMNESVNSAAVYPNLSLSSNKNEKRSDFFRLLICENSFAEKAML